MSDAAAPTADPPTSAACSEPAPRSAEHHSDLAETAGGFIHDIKNHLGTLSLNLQLLAEDFENPQTPRERQALERVTRLHGECQKLVDLSNDFLRYARAQELDPRPTSLGLVVDRMIDFLTPTARQRGIEIIWVPAADLPLVDLDRDLFEQALLNLMLNAEQAMPDGGTLTLMGRVELSESATGSLSHSQIHTRTRKWVCLDVIDNGCGMTAEVLMKVFQPFHTTKKNGNGLGLPTARKVVLAHGGRLDVQSEPGMGSKFTIRLPASV